MRRITTGLTAIAVALVAFISRWDRAVNRAVTEGVNVKSFPFNCLEPVNSVAPSGQPPQIME